MSDLLARLMAVRSYSEALCAPLAVEDYVPQPTSDVSPPKWHLAHTTWFFDRFILQPAGIKIARPAEYDFLFNSYYESEGVRIHRAHRGHLSRPTVAQIMAYRAQVNEGLQTLFANKQSTEFSALLELGLQHEQQHQELLITDIKYILGTNPLLPAYDAEGVSALDVTLEHLAQPKPEQEWVSLTAGLYTIGHSGEGFALDHESAQHSVYIEEMSLRNRLVMNAEYVDFIKSGGYQNPLLWHSDGWHWRSAEAIHAPLYWQEKDGGWQHYTLSGLAPLNPDAAVTHISFYEAAAFCQWAGFRLPTEFEWEASALKLHIGSGWEWTQSSFLPYPRFQKSEGAVGEYNGKFMVNQQVLRGASFATPKNHSRITYRNFFHPPARWQYTTIRLAK